MHGNFACSSVQTREIFKNTQNESQNTHVYFTHVCLNLAVPHLTQLKNITSGFNTSIITVIGTYDQLLMEQNDACVCAEYSIKEIELR